MHPFGVAMSDVFSEIAENSWENLDNTKDRFPLVYSGAAFLENSVFAKMHAKKICSSVYNSRPRTLPTDVHLRVWARHLQSGITQDNLHGAGIQHPCSAHLVPL